MSDEGWLDEAIESGGVCMGCARRPDNSRVFWDDNHKIAHGVACPFLQAQYIDAPEIQTVVAAARAEGFERAAFTVEQPGAMGDNWPPLVLALRVGPHVDPRRAYLWWMRLDGMPPPVGVVAASMRAAIDKSLDMVGGIALAEGEDPR